MFSWSEYEDYEANLSKAEEKLIKKHFEQLIEESDWDLSGNSSLELNFKFKLFRYGWILGQMFSK